MFYIYLVSVSALGFDVVCSRVFFVCVWFVFVFVSRALNVGSSFLSNVLIYCVRFRVFCCFCVCFCFLLAVNVCSLFLSSASVFSVFVFVSICGSVFALGLALVVLVCFCL